MTDIIVGCCLAVAALLWLAAVIGICRAAAKPAPGLPDVWDDARLDRLLATIRAQQAADRAADDATWAAAYPDETQADIAMWDREMRA